MNPLAKLGTAAALAVAVFFYGRCSGAKSVAGAVERAQDKAQKHELQRYSVIVDSMRDAIKPRVDTVLVKAPKVIAALESSPRVQIVTDTLVQTPDSLVNVYVESEQKAFPAHAFLARLLQFDDSLIHQVAIPQARSMVSTIIQQRAVIDSSAAYQLAQQVRITTLETRLAHTKPSKVASLGKFLLGAGAGYLVARAVR